MRQFGRETEYDIEYASDQMEQADAIEESAIHAALQQEGSSHSGGSGFDSISEFGIKTDSAGSIDDFPDGLILSEHADSASSERKQLRRDLQSMALRRLEDSARTEADFRNVIAWWDRLDASRERRERYHEVGRDTDLVPLEWGAKEDGLVFPQEYNSMLWKQILKGEFLDVIFNCPLEIHELTEDADLFVILRDLKDNHKEIFYYLFIRYFSTCQVGALRGQSDRNIRKVRTTILKRIRRKYAEALKARHEDKDMLKEMTKEQKEFLKEYQSLIDKASNRK